jgi:hypothetical protein
MKFSVEISKTLETLRSKSENAQNCNLILAGGVLKEVVHTYVFFTPNFQVPSAENPKKSRLYGFCRRERGWLKDVCAMGSSRPML